MAAAGDRSLDRAVLGSFIQLGDGITTCTWAAPQAILLAGGNLLSGQGTVVTGTTLADVSFLDGTMPGTGVGIFVGTLEIALINDFVPTVGETFNLFNGNLSGTLGNVVVTGLDPGVALDFSQLLATGNASVTAPVPEPGSLALAGMGLVGLVGYVLRRHVAVR